MKPFGLVVYLMVCLMGNAAWAVESETENAITQRIERQERILLQNDVLREHSLRIRDTARQPSLDSLQIESLMSNDYNSCLTGCMAQCSGGTGGVACWNQCIREGYGSATCASRCGVTSESGSEACWNQCTKESYGSATCSDRCGRSTDSGSLRCWNQCTRESYGSATCASRCGVSTPSGSGACWNQCIREGYGSATCASRCGTH